MRLLWCSLAALSTALLARAQSTGFESRPLTDSGLQNVIAFTRLMGYVQYFHPSDEASSVNWEAFAVAGMEQVEDAPNPQALADRLTAIFVPVAPTLLVFRTGARPEIPAGLHPASTAGLSVMRWDYLGFPSNPLSSASPYKGARVRQAPGSTDPAAGFEVDLGAGIFCFVPVALYADSSGTLPRATAALPALPGPPWSASRRGLRLAATALMWNIAQHFYPYFDVVNTDWQQALRTALPEAAAAVDEAAFWDALLRLGSNLRDGHFTGNTFRIAGAPRLYVPPIAWEWIEGRLVVTFVADSQGQEIHAGDAILSIDGKPVEQSIAEAADLVSAGTRQYQVHAALNRIGTGAAGTTITFEVESGGTARTVAMRRTQYTSLNETLGAVPEPRPDPIATLEADIFYVDVSRAAQADWTAALPRFTGAKGVIIDYRGYPNFFPVANFFQGRFPGLGLWTAKPELPDQRRVTMQDGSWDITGSSPFFNARVVYLTDGRAISAAETHLVIVESNGLADIVGSPTAGSDGYVTWFRLFGLYAVGFTGQVALKPDKSPIHGIGSVPTIPVQRTRAGVAAGRDEILDRALELLHDPAARPRGPWVASAASMLPDSACAGAILTILAPALGPQSGASSRLTADGRVDTLLNDTRVFFDDLPAPLLYAGPAQVNAIVPFGAAGKVHVRMRVEYKGQETFAAGVAIAPAAPAIFSSDSSGRGQGAILNQEQTVNSAARPADRGSIVSIFATGGGLMDVAMADGSIAGGALARLRLPVSARIGGRPAEVQYAGAAPGMVAGTLQINVRIPAEVGPGKAAVFVTIGDATSQPGITVQVR